MPSLNLAVFIKGVDYSIEYNLRNDDNRTSYHYEQAAKDALRQSGITTKRKNPESVSVTVFLLKIKGLELVRNKVATFHLIPPLERMTEDEYNTELNKLLKELPNSFHPFITREAYERGHSAGYEEIINIAQEMVNNLTPCIQNYKIALFKK